MNSKVLSFVNKLEGYKTAIKSLHWDSDSLSQHELCDKIADTIAEFQDTVSEVEQSITGKLEKGKLQPEEYKVTTLKKFVEDVLDAANTFYKSIEDEGDTYTGMRSDCESFLSDMQRNLYLVNFTMKEDLKRRIANKLNEGYRKEENEKKFNLGRHTENLTDGGMAKRISDIIKNSQFNKRPFNSLSDCVERCQRTFSKAGELHVIGNMENVVFLQLDAHNGYSYFGQIVISESDRETGGVVCTVSFNPSGIKNNVQEPEPQPEGMPIEDEVVYEVVINDKPKVNESISAHDIFRQVKHEIFDLKNTGELEVPIVPNDMYVPTSDDFLKAYFQAENEITVEYNGKTIKVPCNINADDDIIARCIMSGFARMVLGKMNEGKSGIHIKPENKGKFTATKKWNHSK